MCNDVLLIVIIDLWLLIIGVNADYKLNKIVKRYNLTFAFEQDHCCWFLKHTIGI